MSKKVHALQGPWTWVPLVLSKQTKMSPDTFLFRFSLPSPDHCLGLPVGQNIQVRAPGMGEGGAEVIRAYTPVSSNDDLGYLELLIKVYFKDVHPSFPNGGLMSQYIHGLKVGETLDIRGPTGRLLYHGQGKFSTRPDKLTDYAFLPGSHNRINMIAGGSGITPMLQIIRAILKDPFDETSVALLFANRSVDDILCREELEEIRDKWPHRFKIWFTLSNPPPDEGEWNYGRGLIREEMLKSQLFPPSSEGGGDETMTLICGPPGMIKFAVIPNLDKLAYPAAKRINFKEMAGALSKYTKRFRPKDNNGLLRYGILHQIIISRDNIGLIRVGDRCRLFIGRHNLGIIKVGQSATVTIVGDNMGMVMVGHKTKTHIIGSHLGDIEATGNSQNFIVIGGARTGTILIL